MAIRCERRQASSSQLGQVRENDSSAAAACERRRQRGRFFAPIARHADGERILRVRGGVRPQARSGKGREGAGRLVDIKNAPNWIQWPVEDRFGPTRSRSARLSDAKPPKADGPPGRDGCAGACRGLWRLQAVELCRTDASARGGEETCTSLLGPRADGITAGYRRGDEASWELLMRFGAESQPLLSARLQLHLNQCYRRLPPFLNQSSAKCPTHRLNPAPFSTRPRRATPPRRAAPPE